MAKLYLSHNFVQHRSCGDCTLCCKVLGIEDEAFSKPAGQLCGNCTGTGCAIYETRPFTCQTFYCLWRRVEAMAEDARPDKTGVIFTLEGQKNPTNPFEWLYIVARADGQDPALYDQPMVQDTLKLFSAEGTVPVWINQGGEKRLAHPPAPMVELLMDMKAAEGKPGYEEARAWAERYERFVAAFWEERDRAAA